MRARRPEVLTNSKDDRDGRLHRQARRPCSQAREEYGSAPPAEKARAQVSQGPRLHSEDPTTTANPHGSWGGEKHPDPGTGTSALPQSTRVGAAPGVGSTARTWPQGRQHGGATRAPSRHATRLSRAPSRPVTRLRHILAHLLSPSAALTPSEVLAESRPSTPVQKPTTVYASGVQRGPLSQGSGQGTGRTTPLWPRMSPRSPG